MTELSDLIEFIGKERLAQEAEVQGRGLLSIEALVSLGYAVNGLQWESGSGSMITWVCNENHSRFRPGDKLVFRHSNLPSFKGTLYDLRDQGRSLRIVGGTFPDLKGTGPWVATEDDADMSASIRTAMMKLQPGAPGWTFAKRLLGISQTPTMTPTIIHHDLVNALIGETGMALDKAQLDFVYQCLLFPPILCCQGPPGTGKTILLAFIAEALMRLGKRSVLLAPTHQAVNNALSTIHMLFPSRRVKKFGDELRRESLSADIPIITSPQMIRKEPIDTIVGLTYMSAVHQLMISDTKMVTPNVLLIDEVGQLPLTQGICAGLSGAGSILLFGDDQQMPPVFVTDLADDPSAISTFAQLRKAQPQVISMLNVTHRLNEPLCQAIGSAFYSDNNPIALSSSSEAKNRRFPAHISQISSADYQTILSPDANIVWVQVPARNCTQQNLFEAKIASSLVAECMKAGVTEKNIAVVTPFRRQVMLIRRLVESQLGNGVAMPIIDTVERVQGLTVDAVVVSLCAADLDYVASIADFIFSSNRLNVAISRARTKAIVLSSPDIFNALPNTYSGILARKKCQAFLDSPACLKFQWHGEVTG